MTTYMYDTAGHTGLRGEGLGEAKYVTQGGRGEAGAEGRGDEGWGEIITSQI